MELSVLDRTGHIQIPRDALDEMGIHGKAHMRVELDDGKIILIPYSKEKD